jgi:UDP-N-acetylglucosamine:LPS N-acetylglucosamine transferase
MANDFINAVELMSGKIPKVLAISSGGGHWIQLLRLRPALEGCDVTYATVREGYREDIGDADFHLIRDGNRWRKTALLRSAFGILLLLIRLRPDIVITTGAAPGYFGVRIGKWLGARVIWVDSVANADELSMSGEKAGSFVDLWLTQWRHLARNDGPEFMGSVL